VDQLDAKHDKTDRKIDFMSSVQIDIYSQVTQVKQMLSEKREDKAPPKSPIPKAPSYESKTDTQQR